MNERQHGKPNVVDIGSRTVGEHRGGELLDAVNEIAVSRVHKLAANLFENVDDALFDLAEKAESNTIQARYFDGMREVRRKRQLVERVFVNNVQNHFKRFASGKNVPGAAAARGPAKDDEDELSLVDEGELEESLAVTSMVSKAENTYARTLYAVNQRLSVISGGRKVEDNSNPIGPASICECFRGAMQELEADINVKIIIYKLFERYVLAGLGTLYDEVNTHLMRAGVLPQLRHRVGSRDRRQQQRAQHTLDGDDGYDDDAADDESSDAESALRQELYATVRDLLTRRRSARPVRQRASKGPALSLDELVAALALLQQQAPPVPADVPDIDEVDDDEGSIETLKSTLRSQIEHVRENTQSRVSDADEDTIDLVSMLFEYILEDRNLPSQMQALLGRLQIPYIKAGLLDRSIFSNEAHPARQLLDHLADAAKGWTRESDRGQRLLDEIKAIVASLLHEFEDDVAIFGQLLQRFDNFIASKEARAERAEKRATETIRGKEKLEAARRAAAREVWQRTQDKDLPRLVRNILNRPWANYLVLTALRQGEDSIEWRDAVQFIDDFIASTHATDSADERKRIRTMLPDIEKTLRHGLSTVAFSDQDTRRLMRALGYLYQERLGATIKGKDGKPARMPKPPEHDEPVIPEAVEEIVKPEMVARPEMPSAAEVALLKEDSAELQQAKGLKLGVWIEFVSATGKRERAKLSWISPISGKYLFVNQRGLKVCDMTLQQLAVGIRDGSVVPLEEVPLFDRALDAIVKRLKEQPDDNATTEAVDADEQPTAQTETSPAQQASADKADNEPTLDQ